MSVRNLKAGLGFLALVIMLTVVTLFSASAETEGIFTYTVSNNEVTITRVNCSEIKDIVIPDTIDGYPVTKFGNQAFRDNDNKRGNGPDSLFISKFITNLTYQVFDSSDIKRIQVDADNSFYTADNSGVLFSKDMKTLIQASGGFSVECYQVPDGVEAIGAHAFYRCYLLDEVVLPSSIRTIGNSAFFNTERLKRINIPEGVTHIYDNCFAQCLSLKSVVLPSSLTELRGSAFTECPALKCVVFSEGLKTLKLYLFESDSALEQVYIPASIKTIAIGVFGNCTSLTDICYAGSAEDWSNISIDTSSYAGSRPVVIDTCNIHYNTPIEAYKTLTYENDNDILTFSGNGTIPGGWHYWDADKDTVTTVLVNGDYQAIEAGAFTDYPELTTVILNTENTTIADGAFSSCPNMQAVLCFGGSSFSADAFDFEGMLKVYENADSTHSMSTPQEKISVIPYCFSDSALQLLADVNFDSYEFFDTMAAFTLQYDNIQKLSFRRFTFDSIPMYYYPEEDSGTRRIEDDTLVNGEMYPMIDVEGEATPITFNALVNGLADKSISSFYLISSDENHKQIKDTQVTVSDDTDDSGFLGFVRKAMRWVITLLNKLFTIISRLGK